MEKFNNLMFFNVNKTEAKIIDSWMSESDKKFLCMEEKGWGQTARDIENCLRFSKEGRLFNLFACVNNTPAVAIMMGIEESGKVLRIYNLITKPEFRNQGFATEVLKRVLNPNFLIGRTFNEIKIAEFKDNVYSLKILKHLNFKPMQTEENLVQFSRPVLQNERTL